MNRVAAELLQVLLPVVMVLLLVPVAYGACTRPWRRGWRRRLGHASSSSTSNTTTRRGLLSRTRRRVGQRCKQCQRAYHKLAAVRGCTCSTATRAAGVAATLETPPPATEAVLAIAAGAAGAHEAPQTIHQGLQTLSGRGCRVEAQLFSQAAPEQAGRHAGTQHGARCHTTRARPHDAARMYTTTAAT